MLIPVAGATREFPREQKAERSHPRKVVSLSLRELDSPPLYLKQADAKLAIAGRRELLAATDFARRVGESLFGEIGPR